MQRKHRWRLLLILFFVFGGLFLTRNQWQPWLFGLILPRQEKLEGIKLIIDLINASATLLTTIFLLLLSKPKEKSFGNPKLLKETSPEKILTDYVSAKPDEISWLDRQILTTSDLRSHPRILLVGRMKSGKTREAAELIRKAISEEILIPSRIYDITENIRSFPTLAIQSELDKELDRGTRVLFYVNDIPKQSTGNQIQVLSTYLKAVEKCSPGYFLATARSDHLEANPDLKKWLDENDFTLIEMIPLTHGQRRSLIDECSRVLNIEIEEEAKRILINKSDGTPYHIILTFKFLAQEGFQKITPDQALVFATKTSGQIWTEIRQMLKQNEQAVVSLLEVLAVFHLANVNPYSDLIVELTASIELQKRGVFQSRAAMRGVKDAVNIVKPYGIYTTSLFVFPDVAVETLVPANEGKVRLEKLIKEYRRFFRHPLLWRFNQQANRQQSILNDLAVSYYYEKDLKKAEELLRLALIINPPTVNAWSDLGVVLSEQKKHEEAEQAFRQALKINPNIAPPWSNLGMLLDELGRNDEAEQSYRRALAISPNLPQPWANLGALLVRLERFDEAEQAYQRALAIAPNNADIWYNLAAFLEHSERHLEAERALRQVLAFSPNDPKAWSDLGATLFYLERPEESNEAFRRALEVDPNDSEAWFNWGTLFRSLNQFEEAKQAVEHAILLKPEEAIYLAALGSVLRKLGLIDASTKLLSKAKQISEGATIYERACIAALSGEEDQAIKLLTEALSNGEVKKDWVQKDPDWNDYRNDSRFIELVGEE